jgi:4'-phosphopantetheinyl transferase
MRVLFTVCNETADIPESWLSGMSKAKRSRVERLKFNKDRVTAVTAHRLLCRGLKEMCGFVPNEDDWREGEFGKPYLNKAGVFFNISHSESIAMCALDDKEVGADIEMIRAVKDPLAERVMSAAEKEIYFPERDREFFFSVWTLKESYLKFRGCGIQGLKDITAYPEGSGITSNAKGCGFALIRGIGGYMAAVCCKRECEPGFKNGGEIWDGNYEYVEMKGLFDI